MRLTPLCLLAVCATTAAFADPPRARRPRGRPPAASPAPTPSDGVRAVSLAAAGGAFCAALANGEVWCWGANGEGILGAAAPASHTEPVRIAGLRDIVQVAGHRYGAMCARGRGGEVWCWGRGGDGLLGTGSLDDRREPTAVEGLRDAEHIAVGSFLACAVRRGGAVSCWGRLPGARTAAREPTPRPTAIESFRDAVEVGAGNNLACARTRAGAVQCVGAATHLGGAPADGTAVAVPGVSGATALAVGAFEACAVGARGAVTCWGSTANLLGRGPGTTIGNPPAPVRGVTGARAVAISTGVAYAMGADGRVWTWGSADALRRGPPSIDAVRYAAEVSGSYPGAVAVAVSSQDAGRSTWLGDPRSCLLFESGAVSCFTLAPSMVSRGGRLVPSDGVEGPTAIRFPAAGGAR
ncbi:MAG: hypothetical protein U0324_09040 [Polyangiales bacterium]